jgi:hypothetical protein
LVHLHSHSDAVFVTVAVAPGCFVSTRIGDGARNELAIRLGFGAKPREDGTLTIGTANFALLTEGENAFLKNPAQEVQLLEAMDRCG